MKFMDFLRLDKSFALPAMLFLGLAILTVPGCGKGGEENNVVSKRVKIELPEKKLPTEAVPDKVSRAEAETGTMSAKKESSPNADSGDVTQSSVSKKESSAKQPMPDVAREPLKSETRVETRSAKTKETTVAAAELATKNAWAINVASFTTEKSALNLRERLRKAGYNAYTTEFLKNGKTWYRVRVGFFSTKEKAMVNGKKIEISFDTTSPWIVKPAKEEVIEHIK